MVSGAIAILTIPGMRLGVSMGQGMSVTTVKENISTEVDWPIQRYYLEYQEQTSPWALKQGVQVETLNLC